MVVQSSWQGISLEEFYTSTAVDAVDAVDKYLEDTSMGFESGPWWKQLLNIATGETSQDITPFHFFDNSNFHH